MANKSLFQSIVGKLLPRTDTLNEEGVPAYAFEPRHALAQYAATGCMNATFYASAEEQLETVLRLCGEVEPDFVAKTAIYARTRAAMKDLPALLLAVLATKSPELLAKAFPRIVDNPKMLRNFVQIVRSGVVGRKSLGTVPKRLVLEWLAARSDEQLFAASVGNAPSLADVVKMVHPKPTTRSRAALYGYLIGRTPTEEQEGELPAIVRQYEAYKKDPATTPLPAVPFQLLTALPLGTAEWVEIARRASWQETRMNLNTFARHGVFSVPGLAEAIAERLRDPEAVKRSRALPYQLMMAFTAADAAVPAPVREALQDAMEVALTNVPEIAGQVYVLPDVSGSMSMPVTGARQGATTAVRCIDVAALVAAAILRKNPRAEVLPFEEDVVTIALNPRDSVMTNAAKLAAIGGGGTNCSAPLARLNDRRAKGDLVIYVSDNESWMDFTGQRAPRATETMRRWEIFKRRNPAAKLVCVDLQPYGSTQAQERTDIVNVGGFSDQVFQVIADVASGGTDAGHWVRQIEAVNLEVS